MESEQILAEVRQRLQQGYAVATGIGVFAVIFRSDGKALLRRRIETDSMYQQDLSGKWEMTGGGVELQHFENMKTGAYLEPIRRAILQELQEEAGLDLTDFVSVFLPLFPAWLSREYVDRVTGEKRTTIDLAFVTPLVWQEEIPRTDEFHRKLERGELKFFSREELSRIEIVSPRTKFLIETAFDAFSMNWVSLV